ncbi:hypothetical protein D3C80_2117340 [compost metagenome]
MLCRQLTTIALDAPLGDLSLQFVRGNGDSAGLGALCEALRFGPMTRRRLYQSAGLDFAASQVPA